MKIQTVAVIGAGVLGRRLAGFFVNAGFDTVLEDILPSNLRSAAQDLEASAEASAGSSVGSKQLRFASSVEDAVRAADLIVDCVPDELESKLEIFSLMDRMAPPRAVFVTPTTNLSIADLASCTYRADRCIAVEFADRGIFVGETIGLVFTTLTSSEVLTAVKDFWANAGFLVQLRTDPAEASVAAGTLF